MSLIQQIIFVIIYMDRPNRIYIVKDKAQQDKDSHMSRDRENMKHHGEYQGDIEKLRMVCFGVRARGMSL